MLAQSAAIWGVSPPKMQIVWSVFVAENAKLSVQLGQLVPEFCRKKKQEYNPMKTFVVMQMLSK